MFPFLVAIATAIAPVVQALAVAKLAIDAIKVIAKAVMGLAKALGLVPENTKPEDLGDKAIQAEQAGIIPEKYDSYASYMKAVQEFKVDPEKSKQISAEEKYAKCAEIASALMTEKFGEGMGEFILSTAINNKDFFDEKMMGELGKVINGDSSMIGKISDLVNGKEKDENVLQGTISTLAAAYKSANPTVSDSDALARVMKL